MGAAQFSIVLAGDSFVLKAPPVKDMNALGKRFLRKRDRDEKHSAKFFIDVAFLSLRISYPDIQRSFIAQEFDLQSIEVVSRAIEAWKADAEQGTRGAAARRGPFLH